MIEKSVYWILQNRSDVPADGDWLSIQEKSILNEMQFPRRQDEWKLGRWTAKQLIHSYLKTIDSRTHHLCELEILAAEDGSPQVFIQNKHFPIKLSLSHRANRAFCVLDPFAREVGCDLEVIEERSDEFISDYFTFEEKLKVIIASGSDKSLFTNLIWSAKESALKALHQGLKSDTRSVIIQFSDLNNKENWNRLKTRSSEFGRELFGWWKVIDGFVLTIMTDDPTAVPLIMKNR
jgi:4'-phosphopantetheinyl transferase